MVGLVSRDMPGGARLNLETGSGASSGLIVGSFIFSGVAITSPVLIRFSTFWPSRCSTIALTAR